MPDCLITLAKTFLATIKDTNELTEAEKILFDVAPLGEPADGTKLQGETGLTKYAEVHQPNTIRATLIRWICSDPQIQKLIDPGGIRIENCWILGRPSSLHPPRALDLCSLSIPFPLIFHKCSLPQWLLLLGTQIPFLDLDGCHVGSIAGDVLKVRGDLYMRNGFRSDGVIKFPGAVIGGDFDCSGANLVYVKPTASDGTPPLTALLAEGIRVAGDVLMNKGTNTSFNTTGRVNLDGAQIDGDLKCTSAVLNNPAIFDEPKVSNDTAVSHDAAKKEAKEGSGEALTVRLATVGGNVYFDRGFSAQGAVRFTGSTIKGSIECGKKRAEFNNPWKPELLTSGVALDLDGANIVLDLFLSADKRDLTLEDHKYTGENRFKSNGTVSLVGTRIGRTFHCKFGEFMQSEFRKADTPENAKNTPSWHPALDLREAHAAFLCYPRHPAKVTLKSSALALDGFTYERISDGAKEADDCLHWIGLQYDPPEKCEGAKIPNLIGTVFKQKRSSTPAAKLEQPKNGKAQKSGKKFFPQPYLQLAKVLSEEGATREARKILIAMEARRPRNSLFDKAWEWLQRVTIGYGYESWKAFKWLFWLFVICSLAYEIGYLNGGMVPTDKDTYRDFVTQHDVRNGYPAFHPILYSLESSLPLLKFGQIDHWQPDPGKLQKGSLIRLVPDWLYWFVSRSGWLSIVHSLQLLLGYFLATMAVAGLTGIVRRE